MQKRYFILAAVFISSLMLFQNCGDVAFVSMPDTANKYNQACVASDFPELEPVEKYRWDFSNSTYPDYQNVMSTPMVGDIDGDKMPEIVFASYAGSYGAPAILRVLSGRDGREVASYKNDSLAPRADTSPLIIDIDRDGKGEIVFVDATYTKVVALNSDLSHRWTHEDASGVLHDCLGGPAAGDLNGDGRSEIIVENLILSEASDRSVSARSVGPYRRTNCTTFAISADPSAPSQMQVVTGAGVYRDDGSAIMEFPGAAVSRGRRLAVADIEKEKLGLEIVFVSGGRLSAYNILSGQELWASVPLASDPTRASGSAGEGGPPTIADFTGDGKPDIAVAGAVFYSVYNHKGELVWKKETNDHSSNVTGSSSFDFNGDGISEVLYADEGYLRIYNGPTGDVLFTIPNPSHTHLEYPLVVDVDADGHSELVVVGNAAHLAAAGWETDPDKLASIRAAGPGIKVYGARSAQKWVPTRAVWNQYSHYVSNVNDDLTAVSSTPISMADGLEVFRQNKLNIFDRKLCTDSN